jgi:hypothetical protein
MKKKLIEEENLKNCLKLNNHLTIEIDIDCGQLECLLDPEVEKWLEKEIFKCFQNYVSVFGTLPYDKHNFFISVPNEEDDDIFISINITNYTTFNGNKCIFVHMVEHDITSDFNDTVKIYLSKDNTVQTFSVVFPLESYKYIKSLLSDQTKKGNLNYGIKAAFLEGLELLKRRNPFVKDDVILERRFYTGGKQKSKTEGFSTSVIIPKKAVNWINNYILQERQNNEFFSKTDFIENLVDQLKSEYVIK